MKTLSKIILFLLNVNIIFARCTTFCRALEAKEAGLCPHGARSLNAILLRDKKEEEEARLLLCVFI